MRNLFYLCVLFLVSSCGNSFESFTVTATIDGEKWTSNSLSHKLNEFDEVVEIKATGENGTRLIFTMFDSFINADSGELPVDSSGVPLATTVSFSAKPSFHNINYQLDVFTPSPTITEVRVVLAEIDQPFTVLEGSQVTGTSFNKVWDLPNERTSDNDYIFYQVEIVHENGQIWKSDITSGLTSFRAKYDASATQQETDGEFLLSRLDRGSKIISGDFYFNTQDHVISSGRIDSYQY